MKPAWNTEDELATTSLILGALSVLYLMWFLTPYGRTSTYPLPSPNINIFVIFAEVILGIASIFTGAFALYRMEQHKYAGRKHLAKTGVILGIFSVLGFIGCLAYMGVLVLLILMLL